MLCGLKAPLGFASFFPHLPPRAHPYTWSHAALTVPPSIISRDLQVTDKAYNIRTQPPERGVSFLTSPPRLPFLLTGNQLLQCLHISSLDLKERSGGSLSADV